MKLFEKIRGLFMGEMEDIAYSNLFDEKAELEDKVKSLQQTVDLQLEVIEQMREENANLIKEVFRLKAKKKKGEKR